MVCSYIGKEDYGNIQVRNFGEEMGKLKVNRLREGKEDVLKDGLVKE
jgi:hypothetical protein